MNFKIIFISCLIFLNIRTNSQNLQKDKPKIAIVSLYDDGYKNIGQYSDWNKKAYAKKHGYDIYLHHEKLDLTRPAAWSKILAIERHLDDYEWIFWSDADSLIMNDDIKLESIIDNNYNFIITQEANKKNLNTGSFLIRNCEWSKQLLKDIYSQVQFINVSGFWEQAALAHLLKTKKELNKHIKVMHQRVMNSHITEPRGEFQPGDFVIHFYSPVDKKTLMAVYYTKALNYELQKITHLSERALSRILNDLNNLESGLVGAWKQYYHVLPKLIHQFDLKVGCEIGVAFGTHSEAILQNTKIKKLYSIDPYKHFDNYNDPMNLSQQHFDALYYKVSKRLEVFDDRSALMRSTSIDASKTFNSNELDFVFIDSQHSYEAVSEDLEAWYEKIRSGGILSGDDYGNEWPGVKKAVNEFFGIKQIKINQDPRQKRIWWVIKP